MAGAYVFENPHNFRAVVPGRLYRSDSVAYASAADAAHLVDAYGLATVVDLRGEMATTLERMRATWGSGEGWARAHGLTGADLAALRSALRG